MKTIKGGKVFMSKSSLPTNRPERWMWSEAALPGPSPAAFLNLQKWNGAAGA